MEMYNVKNNHAPLVWGVVLLCVFCYPWAIEWFTHNAGQLHHYRDSFAISKKDFGKSLTTVFTFAAALIAVFAPPVLGLKLICLKQFDNPASITQRALLHLVVCIPVLFVLIWLVCHIMGISAYAKTLWLCIMGFLCLSCGWLKAENFMSVPSALRVFHGVLAALFILGFVLLHWVNHGVALWSSPTHAWFLNIIREWYRSPFIEPVLLTIVALLVATGFYMAVSYLRQGSTYLRRLQTVSGCYMGLFLCTHLMAIFYARNKGIDSNWEFATGGQGLLSNFQLLIPYYTLSLIAFVMHVLLALRQICMAHNMSKSSILRVCRTIGLLGGLMAIAIMLAAMGFSFHV